jgi:hypothetical protein
MDFSFSVFRSLRRRGWYYTAESAISPRLGLLSQHSNPGTSFPLQTQGSLREAGLASLLQTMQAERATGTLSLENGAENCSLYFLFGHLFHASGPGGQGEEVVIDALSWHDGSYQFDPRAKLPAEETIKSSPQELIERSESHEGVSASPAATGWEEAAALRVLEPAGAPVEAGASAATSYEPLPYEPAPLHASAEPDYAEHVPAADSGLASWTAAQQEPAVPPEEPISYPALPTEPAAVSTPAEAPASTPSTTSYASGGGAVSNGPLPVMVYPLPSGRPHYEGLKSAFVDFPRLLRTLRSDRHTGYINLSGNGYSGVILFNDGQALEAVCSNATAVQGESAFLQIRRHMDGGDGILDVIELPADTVIAIAQLFTAPHIYTGLLGRFVNLDALLEYLGEEKVDGSVVVTAPNEMGVILLRDGSVLGAYTGSHRSLDKTTATVAALAGDRQSRIEVKGGAGSVASIDVDAALSRPY